MGIRGTLQADGRSHSGYSGDGSTDSAQVKGKKGCQQPVFSVGFRPVLAENLIRPIGALFGVANCSGNPPSGQRDGLAFSEMGMFAW